MKKDVNWKESVVTRTLESHDKVKITYMSMGTATDKVVALAHGLGGRLHTWEPLLNVIFPDYRIITWHYRGLYKSESPSKIRHLSIPNHAEDLRCILDAEGLNKASIIGWSMGVQVALEFAALYPERLERLVLLNGTYGHALETGFQPLFHLPGATWFLHELIDTLRATPWLAGMIRKAAMGNLVIGPVGEFYSRLRCNPLIKKVLRQYVDDIFGESFNNYLRLFQELDAHSSYHNLKEIRHPALVVYGNLDFLTPAYLSRKMKRRLKNARSYNKWLGTHFMHLEYPKKVPRRMKAFLDAPASRLV